MENNEENIQLIIQKDSFWAGLREDMEKLLDILGGKKPNDLDVLLGLKCLNLIYLELLSIDYKTDTELIKKDTLDSFIDEVENFSRIVDKSLSVEERQSLIENMRIRIWADIATEKKEIKKIQDNNYTIEDIDKVKLVYRCISVACFELKIRDLEKALLNGELNFPEL